MLHQRGAVRQRRCNGTVVPTACKLRGHLLQCVARSLASASVEHAVEQQQQKITEAAEPSTVSSIGENIVAVAESGLLDGTLLVRQNGAMHPGASSSGCILSAVAAALLLAATLCASQ